MTDTGTDSAAQFLRAQGLDAKPYRQVLRLLLDGSSVAELILGSGLPRRSVERFVELLGDDVERRDDGSLRVNAAGYRSLAQGGDPAGVPDGLLAELTEMLRGRPAPAFHLDQVAARPETLLRRATFLTERYELRGARIACLGDHDMTSLALALVVPEAEIVVCDIDDRILELIAGVAPIDVRFADFRVGLPPSVRGVADLVFIDPPYTPEGVDLFARRSVEALRDVDHGRIVLAYGYGGQPGLGLKVQDALGRLRLVYEALVPGFNRYDGAEAIGRASDLYILRPSRHTAKALDRRGGSGSGPRVYTKGGQSLESASATAVEDLRSFAGAVADLDVVAAIGDWPGGAAPRRLAWSDVLDPARLPPPVVHDGAVIGDLTHDPGSLLLRALLALSSPRVALLVANQHPDIATAAGQSRLRETIGPKYDLRFRRSTPSPQLAIVEGTLTPPDAALDPGAAARRHLLTRAHAKLHNALRESLIAAATTADVPLSKSDARSLIAVHLPTPTQTTLLDLPRSEIDRHLTLAATLTADIVDAPS